LTGQEEKIGFKLSVYYAYCRDVYYKHFVRDFLIWIVYSYIGALVFFFIPFEVYKYAIVATDGMTDGMWSSGFSVTTALIIVHHGVVFISTRNWTTYILGWYAFSLLLFFPFTVLLNNWIKQGGLQYTILTEITRQPLYYLNTILVIVFFLLIFYGWKAFYMLIGKPEFTDNPVVEEELNSKRSKVNNSSDNI